MISRLNPILLKILIAFAIPFTSFAALSLEELNSPFTQEHDYRTLTVEELEKIETALFELGFQDHWNRLEEKLGLTQKEGMALYIRSCQLQGDRLGTYTRGETLTYRKNILFGQDISEPHLIFKQEDILDQINNSYKWYTENNETYISLVIRSWPVICIRPGLSFAQTLSTFVHELEHFLGDQYQSPSSEELTDEFTFREFDFKRPGGEYHAFIAGSRLKIELVENYGWPNVTPILSFFDEYREINDEQGFANYIFQVLEYNQIFRQKYIQAVNNYNRQNTNIYNFLASTKNLYEQNLSISESNLAVAINNIEATEHNKRIYERMNRHHAIEQANRDIETFQRLAQENREAIIFYNNLLTEIEQQIQDLQQ